MAVKGSKENSKIDKLPTGSITVAKLISPILLKKAKTTLPPLKIILFLKPGAHATIFVGRFLAAD